MGLSNNVSYLSHNTKGLPWELDWKLHQAHFFESCWFLYGLLLLGAFLLFGAVMWFLFKPYLEPRLRKLRCGLDRGEDKLWQGAVALIDGPWHGFLLSADEASALLSLPLAEFSGREEEAACLAFDLFFADRDEDVYYHCPLSEDILDWLRKMAAEERAYRHDDDRERVRQRVRSRIDAHYRHPCPGEAKEE